MCIRDRPRTVEEFNDDPRDQLVAKTQGHKFVDWVIEARDANRSSDPEWAGWASKDALRADIGRRFRLKHDRREAVRPLDEDWEKRLGEAAQKAEMVDTKYRATDPLLFPVEV
ncbi:MAG: hypothetical protein KUG77_20030, partial [Nannocystaceae bacterium]|nr:hypothetical protein [Nannocystaceae bacterium]